jgi:predicted transcriptional regulator
MIEKNKITENKNNANLEEIKRLRKKYHLTQKQLADKANVSQSLIAKVEAGMLDPSYTKAQQIFTTLEGMRGKEELKAKDILNTKVMFVQSKDAVREVIKIMRQKGISQIPVLDTQKQVCGLVTERTILEKIADIPEKIGMLKVQDVLEDAPPIVSLNTGFHMLSMLLKENSLVIVMDKGVIKGIISKSDLLGRIE